MTELANTGRSAGDAADVGGLSRHGGRATEHPR